MVDSAEVVCWDQASACNLSPQALRPCRRYQPFCMGSLSVCSRGCNVTMASNISAAGIRCMGGSSPQMLSSVCEAGMAIQRLECFCGDRLDTMETLACVLSQCAIATRTLVLSSPAHELCLRRLPRHHARPPCPIRLGTSLLRCDTVPDLPQSLLLISCSLRSCRFGL